MGRDGGDGGALQYKNDRCAYRTLVVLKSKIATVRIIAEYYRNYLSIKLFLLLLPYSSIAIKNRGEDELKPSPQNEILVFWGVFFFSKISDEHLQFYMGVFQRIKAFVFDHL